mgnify:CR=1 FL=1
MLKTHGFSVFRAYEMFYVTPQVRHPERVFLREGSPECYGFCHLLGDPSRRRAQDDVYPIRFLKTQNLSTTWGVTFSDDCLLFGHEGRCFFECMQMLDHVNVVRCRTQIRRSPEASISGNESGALYLTEFPDSN